jgi:murein DD-endopeptidase MepM/ murein hydrolase activator NlpD
MLKQVSGNKVLWVAATVVSLGLQSCSEAGDAPGTQNIATTGGTVELTGTAIVTFPEGAFSADTRVTIEATSRSETAASFDEFAALYRPVNRLAYELTVRTGQFPPVSESVQVSLVLPADFVAAVPRAYQIEMFAQIFQDGGQETVDSFELFRATLDPTISTLTAEVPTAAFSNNRDETGDYIAVVTAAPTPGSNRSIVTSGAALSNLTIAGKCEATSIGCPVGGGCMATSPYSTARRHPVTGESRPHYGTDYRAATGTDILAAADGTVERSYTSSSYGETIVVRHDDGGATLYAHLETRGVARGARVLKGSAIGTSDSTGLSQAPHLHFEYAPNGEIIQSKNRIDPDACVDALGSGSITVRDNGNLADDAFDVTLDGLRLGATAIGDANTLAVSNLIPGPHVLGITAIVAPDDAGTYEVTLNEGVIFASGGTSASGVLPQGRTTTYTIVAPRH